MSSEAVFENEQAMLKQLEAMGMPRQLLQSLKPEQIKAMYAKTSSPEVLARAQERVAHEEVWKKVDARGDLREYEWKNTRDDVFVTISLPSGVKSSDVKCVIETNHLAVKAGEKVLLDCELFQEVHTKESTWKIQDETLALSLRKIKAPMRWLSLTR